MRGKEALKIDPKRTLGPNFSLTRRNEFKS